MKLSRKIVAKQSQEIQQLLISQQKETLALIKKKYPDLIKAMARKWDMNEDDLLSNSYYVNLEDYLF